MRYDGTKLKRLRLERGLTQTQVSDYTGINQPVISEVESGVTQNPPTFKRLAEFYGIEMSELIVEEEQSA